MPENIPEPRSAGRQSTSLPTESPPVKHTTEPIDNLHRAEGIPKEVFKMFEVELMHASPDTLTKLKDISTWAFDGQTFVGDGLMKLRDMVERISPTQKNKFEAVWNVISLQRKIDLARREVVDLEKRKIAIYGDGRSTSHPATLRSMLP